LLLLPEDCLTGYPGEKDAAFKVAIASDGAEIRQLKEIARKNRIDIAAGYIERAGEHCHSAHCIARADGSHTIVRKYSVDDRDQRIGITPALAQEDELRVGGAKAALAICMDGNDAFFATAKRKGAKIILHPSGGACAVSAHEGDADAAKIDAAERAGDRKCLESAQKRARDLEAVYLVANTIGFDGERGYPGNSFIVSAGGEVLAYLEGTAIIEKMKEGVVCATVMVDESKR